MQLGIDTAWPQGFLDLNIPWGQGFRSNYVKLGGDNDGRYVADTYPGLLDRSRVLGYRCGHYWVPDDVMDPTGAADYYVDNLRGWTARDFAVLDNENLNGAVRYGDARAATWIERVKSRKSIPGRQVFVYTNLSDARAITWTRVLATGAMFIIAAPSYPAGQWPDIPTIPRERIVGHQYGTAVFGGVTTDVDWWTDDAFNYGGITMESQMRQYAAANQKPYDAATWDQMCGSLMHRFNTWRGWVTMPREDAIQSAYEVATNSGMLRTDFTQAPVGAWHFFDIAGPSNGHVMQDARGGGLVCFSTGYALSEVLGKALGFQSVPGYVAAKGAHYMGWATNYAGGTITVAGTAGGGYNPIEEDDMFTDEDRQRQIEIHAALGAGGAQGLADERTVLGKVWTISDRIVNVDRQVTGADGFAPSVAGRVIDIQSKVVSGGVDVGALAAEIVAQLPEGTIDTAAIVAGVEAALVDDLDLLRARLAQLPDDVRAALKEAL